MFIAALFIVAKIPKYLSTDKWIKKMWCIHTHTHTRIYIHTYIYINIYIYSEILLSHKKD